MYSVSPILLKNFLAESCEKEKKMIPKNNEIYKHFKGNLYKIITMAVHSETGEQMVVYQGLYGDYPVYCRPLDMFVSEVDHEKYPEVTQKFRFEPVNGLVSADTCVTESATLSSDPVNEKMDENVFSVSVQEETEAGVDPMILEFLDAGTNAQKRNILTGLHHRITNEMIDTLAVVMDVVIEEGDVEERYQQLKTCLDTIDKYEIERKI